MQNRQRQRLCIFYRTLRRYINTVLLLFMVALCNRADHIYFHAVSSFFWNVLHVARWKYRTQKWRKKSPSGHNPTNLSGYIFATKACIDNRKNFLNSNTLFTCPLRPTNGWDRLARLGHPSKFQRVSRLGFVTASTSVIKGQPNFVRCLAISWLVYYIYM